MTKVQRRIIALLDTIKADFPRRKTEAERLMKELGLDMSDPWGLDIAPPEPVDSIPTFDIKVFRKPTPMLEARFKYAGSWKMGQDIWLSAAEMLLCRNRRGIRKSHRAFRENWEGSAPMIFPDCQLTPFGITEGVPGNSSYLVWAKDGEEPELWEYVGWQSRKFKDLEEYLRWCIERE